VVEKKVNRLDKYFKDDAKAKVYFKNVKNTDLIEITVCYDGQYLRAQVGGANMFENVDLALPKIEKQIIKHKTKIHNRLKSDAFATKELLFESAAVPEKVAEVVRTKIFELVPMTVEEAIANMDMLEHKFYIFQNIKTDKTEVVYLRDDGNVGVIQPLLKQEV
jgi:putative sigma-54 modulation protein